MLSELEELFFSIFPFVFVFIIIMIALKSKRTNADRSRQSRPKMPIKPAKTVSSDGHMIEPENDPTCAKYGHMHEEVKHRYVVHDEPVEGYVNLNGKLMTLKEAAKY